MPLDGSEESFRVGDACQYDCLMDIYAGGGKESLLFQNPQYLTHLPGRVTWGNPQHMVAQVMWHNSAL